MSKTNTASCFPEFSFRCVDFVILFDASWDFWEILFGRIKFHSILVLRIVLFWKPVYDKPMPTKNSMGGSSKKKEGENAECIRVFPKIGKHPKMDGL